MRSFDKQTSRDKRIANMLFKSAVNKANKPPLREAVTLSTFDAAGVLSHHLPSFAGISSGQMRCHVFGNSLFRLTPVSLSTSAAYSTGGRLRTRQPLIWAFFNFSGSISAARLVGPPALLIASCIADVLAMRKYTQRISWMSTLRIHYFCLLR